MKRKYESHPLAIHPPIFFLKSNIFGKYVQKQILITILKTIAVFENKQKKHREYTRLLSYLAI